MLSTARQRSPTSHALVALLGTVGLRDSEACATDVTDLRHEAGYKLRNIMGKGRKPALVPLPMPVLRAVHEAIGERSEGPILLSNPGARRTRASAAARFKGLACASSIQHPISPHALRRTFCTTGLVTGVSVREMQYAMRHADAKTTLRYDMARAHLDRHAAHSVASCLAGLSVG